MQSPKREWIDIIHTECVLTVSASECNSACARLSCTLCRYKRTSAFGKSTRRSAFGQQQSARKLRMLQRDAIVLSPRKKQKIKGAMRKARAKLPSSCTVLICSVTTMADGLLSLSARYGRCHVFEGLPIETGTVHTTEYFAVSHP